MTVTGKGKYERNPKKGEERESEKRVKIDPMRTKRRSGGIKKGFERKRPRYAQSAYMCASFFVGAH